LEIIFREEKSTVADKGNNSPKVLPKKGVFELKIIAGYEQSFPTFYSNYAAVSHTPTELCIDFCVMAPPHKIDVDKKTTSVPVIARLLIPEGMAKGLVTALQAQVQKFETTKKTKMIAVEKKDQ
jgi:hypothetical protein